jgi:hypothetical protein
MCSVSSLVDTMFHRAMLLPCWCRVVHVGSLWRRSRAEKLLCSQVMRRSRVTLSCIALQSSCIMIVVCGEEYAEKSCIMKLCSMGENHPWIGRRRPTPGHPQGCGHCVELYEAAGATSSLGGNVGGCKLFIFFNVTFVFIYV